MSSPFRQLDDLLPPPSAPSDGRAWLPMRIPTPHTRLAPTRSGPYIDVEQLPRPVPRAEDTRDLQAELEAERALARSAGQAEGRAEGFQVGYDRGYPEGLAQGEAEALAQDEAARAVAIAEFTDALEAKVATFEQGAAEWFAARESEMAALAIDIVRRILASELELSRASTLAIVKHALVEITHATEARIRVNPFDAPILGQHRAEILAASTSLRAVDIVEDPDIAGGCRIETEGGIVDASMATRLGAVEEAWNWAA